MKEEQMELTDTLPIIPEGNGNQPNQPRMYFNSVTGQIMKDGVDERTMYEIDEDDQRDQDENQIDQYTDVSPHDKRFFKLWNKFIIPKEKNRMNMEKYLIQFIENNKTEINNNALREPLLLHMICLYDYDQIDKKVFLEIIDLLNDNNNNNCN